MKPHLSIRQLIRLSLAVGLLAAFLAPGPAHAQGPPESQGLWQTFTAANSGLRDNEVTALLEDRTGGLWVGTNVKVCGLTTDLFVPVFVQLQRVPEAELFQRLIRLIAKAAHQHTGLLSLVADDKRTSYDDVGFIDDLETIVKAVKQRQGKEARVVLLLDEGEQLNEYSRDTQKRLRGVLIDAVGQEYLRLVWSGLAITDINDDTSPWYNLFAPHIHLAPLNRETAVRLITEPVEGIYQYDEAAIALILKRSGGRPYEVQSLCHAIIEHVKHRIQGQKISPPVRVTANDVKAVAQQPGQVSVTETQYETPSLSRRVAESQSEYRTADGDDE